MASPPAPFLNHPGPLVLLVVRPHQVSRELYVNAHNLIKAFGKKLGNVTYRRAVIIIHVISSQSVNDLLVGASEPRSIFTWFRIDLPVLFILNVCM